MTSTTEKTATTQSVADASAKPTTKPRVGARRAHVAPAKAKSARKASSARKAPKGAKKATHLRDGSKTAKILDLLKRRGGATTVELMKAIGWQPHSVRGFLSDTVGKKMGLVVTSSKSSDVKRNYSVKA